MLAYGMTESGQVGLDVGHYDSSGWIGWARSDEEEQC
jgi:hypothetical protein